MKNYLVQSTHGDNMLALERLYEAAEHYEAEAAKAATLQQLKEQIARVRDAIAKLDEILGGTPGQDLHSLDCNEGGY